MAKKIYVVARGKKPGIYSSWAGSGGAQEQVEGFPGARYKGFTDPTSAQEWIREQGALALLDQLPGGSTPAPSKHQHDLQAGKTIIYTDGAAEPNPGPGGYGAVLLKGEKRREVSGGFRLTTNNRMELSACIEALRTLKQPQAVVLFSDSRYVVDSITKGWAKSWQQRNWAKSDGKPAENSDLWAQLLELNTLHSVEWRWVRGHAGTIENERCDYLAVQAAKGRQLPPDTAYEQKDTINQTRLDL